MFQLYTLLIVSLFVGLFASPLQAATYIIEDDTIGAVSTYIVKKNDSLAEIARRFDLGVVELLAANPGLSQKNLKAGMPLTLTAMHILPLPRQGMVLNLSELRMFYFVDAQHVMTFPIGIGREGWDTPLGITKITKKRPNPVWIPPDSIRLEMPNLPAIVPAGPDNPLGQYALNLGLPGYAIHGTNRPFSVGKRSSHGCIRLYPEDIATLFGAVEVGAPVAIIDTPYKLGWRGMELLLEVTPTQKQSDAIMHYHQPPPVNFPDMEDAILSMGTDIDIDWEIVKQVTAARSGIPVVIGRKSTPN